MSATSIRYCDHYFADADALAAFELYAKRMFGLDFARWKARGLWDPKYQAFSAFDGAECIASMCVYPSIVTIDGTKKIGIQLLTVGTLPAYRRQGMQRHLWGRVQDWASRNGDFVFLFTDEQAAGFYQSLGLERQKEYVFAGWLEEPAAPMSVKYRRLDIDTDVDFRILQRLAHEREPVSDRLGVWNPNLLLFKFLYSYQNKTYYLAEYDTVIVVSVVGDAVYVHDIVARQMPDAEVIRCFLSQFRKDKVRCLFCIDRFAPAEPEKILVTDRVLITSGTLGLEGDFVFPYSAEV